MVDSFSGVALVLLLWLVVSVLGFFVASARVSLSFLGFLFGFLLACGLGAQEFVSLEKGDGVCLRYIGGVCFLCVESRRARSSEV